MLDWLKRRSPVRRSAVELREGKLYVTGEARPFVRDPIGTFKISVNQLSLHSSLYTDLSLWENKDKYLENLERRTESQKGYIYLNGVSSKESNELLSLASRSGAFEDRDRAGLPGRRCEELLVQIFPILADAGDQLSPDNSVDGTPRIFINTTSARAILPRDTFNQLIVSLRTGRVENITLSCKTDLWSFETSNRWYLAPDQTAHGIVEDVSWSEDHGPREPDRRLEDLVRSIGDRVRSIGILLVAVVAAGAGGWLYHLARSEYGVEDRVAVLVGLGVFAGVVWLFGRQFFRR